MKKTLIMPHVTQTQEYTQAESYRALGKYFYPELITAFLLYTALGIIDSKFISNCGSVCAYATLGITDPLVHFITKIADGFSVGMVILCGQYNGIAAYERTGKMVTDAFWATVLLGSVLACLLYVGASGIYTFYGVPDEMAALGVPFLRLRALGVFLNFVYFALLGFLRGIKNTRIPMVLFLIGSLVFLFFDYVLIFGAWGFPQLGLRGSALASVIQYSVMLMGALGYILKSAECRKYSITLFSSVKWHTIRALIFLSWPVMVDKASFALCYIWLAKMVSSMVKAAPLGTAAAILPTYSFIKCAFQVSLLPGLAFAQVITFLVSNDYKAQNWQRIKNNIVRVLIASTALVFCLVLMLMMWPRFFLLFFDTHGVFSDFAAGVIPFMCMFVFFDLMQVILSAALRGAANVYVVMRVRLFVIGLFFIPVSYLFSQLPIDNLLIKFILVYGSLYGATAIMSLIYIHLFKQDEWKQQSIKGV